MIFRNQRSHARLHQSTEPATADARQKWFKEDSLTTWSIAATYRLERADINGKER